MMRSPFALTFCFFFSSSLLFACADDPPRDLSIEVKSGAVGIPLTVQLDISETSCEEIDSWASGPETKCTTTKNTFAELRASCDDDACSVSTSERLTITGLRPGPATVHVHAKDQRGREYEGAASLTFVNAAGLFIRGDGRPDGSELAVMVGAEARWSVFLAMDERSPSLDFDLGALKVEPFGDSVGVEPALGRPKTFDVAFPRAGTSRVRFSVGPFSVERVVRVAAAADVAAIEVHSVRFEPSLAVDPAALTDLAPYQTYASVLVLRDGTKALGGAGFFSRNEGAVDVPLYAHDGRAPNEREWIDPLGAPFFDLYRDGDAAPAVVRAAVGDARGEWHVAP